jgi:hypothetical protein
VVASVAVVGDDRRLRTEMTCTTLFVGGTSGSTTTARSVFRPVPDRLVVRLPGSSPADLCASHLDHLARWEAAGHVAEPVARDRVPAVILEAQQRFVDFHAGRGLFVPMTDEEIERCRRGRAGGDPD